MLLFTTAALSLLAHRAAATPIDPDYSTSFTVVPAAIQNGTSEVQMVYPGYGLDAPRVTPINGTVLDWWYFHAFSTSGDLSSLAFNFYTTSPGGYPLLTNQSTVVDFEIFGSLGNGTPFWANAYPSKAEIMTMGNGSTGRWGSYGNWHSSPDGKAWTIEFNNEEFGLSGSVTMDSNGAPPHLPCGVPEEGGQEEFMPHLFWAQALSDANAQVNLNYKGEDHSFQGLGYHDKTWGDKSFYTSVSSWYWGHGRVGPYSLMFYDTRDPENVEHFMAYLAKDGEIVSSSCAQNSVVARPWGGDDTYPPTMQTGAINGLIVDFDVDGQNFNVNLTNIGTTTENPAYTRWIGTAVGGFEGEEQYEGKAIYEVVKLTNGTMSR